MRDLAFAAGWAGLLVAAFGVAVGLRALGLASTYVRDLLHVGAGVWVLGWSTWDDPVLPIVIVACVAAGIALVPSLSPRWRFVARLERSVTGADEHWRGLVLYTLSYAVFTAVGVTGDAFAAGAALLALSLGDGIGGAVGRRFGVHHFNAPGGKRKSYEGAVVVGCGAFAGALIAAALAGVSLPLTLAFALGIVAALAEGLAPRGTDNIVVPAAVYAVAHLVT